MSKNTLILGLAAGFHYGDLRPFIVSLEQTGYSGRCVLFVSPTTRDIERIQQHGICCVRFQRPQESAHIPYNAFRYFLYKDYLLSVEKNYDRILLTDTRDVIFQRDPFSFAWSPGLNVTLEDRSMRIRDCPHMVRWTGNHLGGPALRQIQQQNISCSGTIIGDPEAVSSYLRQMTELLVPFSPRQRMAGYDQGVHNYLLHTRELHQTKIHDNAGPIFTLGYKRELPSRDAHGNILNESGRSAVLVHQYDRHKDLFRFFRARF